jgi:hypothetical protein
MKSIPTTQTFIHLLTVFIAAVFFSASSVDARIWTSADGNHTIEGKLVGYDQPTGMLQIDKGKVTIKVKYTSLSNKDHAYLLSIGTPIQGIAAASPARTIATQPKGTWKRPSVAEAFTDKNFFAPFPKFEGRGSQKSWLIKTFGPVGVGILMTKPDMTLKINNVEEGSPAAQTRKLKEGQIIESINGQKFGQLDPRLQLAEIITKAEASNGKVVLEIKDQGKVTVSIPVLGSYSETWPLNCPKSDKIVRNLANLIAKQGEKEWGSVLFLLSTGEKKDLDVVRGWMSKRKSIGAHNWEIGYRGIGVCEYYLRTGDQSVLPMIQSAADDLRDRIYNGGWSGRGGSFRYQSGGHLNAAGVHCLTFLLMAKSCGVNVDEKTLQSSLRHFYRYSGRGSVPYGDYSPKPGYTDCNGKTGGLAIAMAAANNLTQQSDKSIYAQAAQINAMKSYYGTNYYLMGHTGGGIGEIWKSASMALVADHRPAQYRGYLNARWWTLELSRRFTGAIGIGGGKESNYDAATGEGNRNIAWGSYHALNYTLARKHLHLFGAPRSEWAKSYTLPVRPWGNPADDAFSSPLPVPGGPWDAKDVLQETLRKNAGKAIREILSADKVSDQTLLTYLHHPEITHRHDAKIAILRLRRDDLILYLLRSTDARMQHNGVMALHELFGTWRPKSAAPDRVTPEMMQQVEKLIRDPNGSKFVQQFALGLLQHTDLDHLLTFKDLLVKLVEDEDTWTHASAISASLPLLMDPASYKELFGPISRTISKTTNYSLIARANAITKQLNEADPAIQDYALKLMKDVYNKQPEELMSERGIYLIPDGGSIKRDAIGRMVGFSDAGTDFLNAIPKATSAWKASGKDSDKYVYDGEFKRNKSFEGTWAGVRHDMFENKADAIPWITGQLKKNKDIPKFGGKSKKGYGFIVLATGEVKPTGLTFRSHTPPMRYSQQTAFSTFMDMAYQFEIFSVGDREFLLMEQPFDAKIKSNEKDQYDYYGIDKNYKAQFKVYIKVK